MSTGNVYLNQLTHTTIFGNLRNVNNISQATPANAIFSGTVQVVGNTILANASANTPATSDNSNNIATTAFCSSAFQVKGNYAPLNSPSFTGIPLAPTPVKTDRTNEIATTAYVQSNLDGFLSLTLNQTISGNIAFANLPTTTATTYSSSSQILPKLITDTLYASISDVNIIKGNITTLNANVSTLQSNVVTINSSISSLTTTVAGIAPALLSGVNTWTQNQTFSGNVSFSGANFPISTLTTSAVYTSDSILNKRLNDNLYPSFDFLNFYYPNLASNNTYTGQNAFNTYIPTTSLSPTTSTMFATKGYVDSIIPSTVTTANNIKIGNVAASGTYYPCLVTGQGASLPEFTDTTLSYDTAVKKLTLQSLNAKSDIKSATIRVQTNVGDNILEISTGHQIDSTTDTTAVLYKNTGGGHWFDGGIVCLGDVYLTGVFTSPSNININIAQCQACEAAVYVTTPQLSSAQILSGGVAAASIFSDSASTVSYGNSTGTSTVLFYGATSTASTYICNNVVSSNVFFANARTSGNLNIGASAGGIVNYNGSGTGGTNSLFLNVTTSPVSICTALTSATLTLGSSGSTGQVILNGASTTSSSQLFVNCISGLVQIATGLTTGTFSLCTSITSGIITIGSIVSTGSFNLYGVVNTGVNNILTNVTTSTTNLLTGLTTGSIILGTTTASLSIRPTTTFSLYPIISIASAPTTSTSIGYFSTNTMTVALTGVSSVQLSNGSSSLNSSLQFGVYHINVSTQFTSISSYVTVSITNITASIPTQYGLTLTPSMAVVAGQIATGSFSYILQYYSTASTSKYLSVIVGGTVTSALVTYTITRIG